MDVVYYLGKGSLENDDELRFSLRSLEKYMADLRKIFVVGEKPDWLEGVEHLTAFDEHKKEWRNVLLKVRQACSVASLSDEFLLMNDDFFALEPFLGSDLPFWSIKGANGGNCGPTSFFIHRPMRIKKEWYLKMPLSVEMPGDFSPRTFYANFYKAPPTPARDLILRPGKGMRSFAEQVRGEPWFSIDDITMTDPEFRQFIFELYPEPSAFEN